MNSIYKQSDKDDIINMVNRSIELGETKESAISMVMLRALLDIRDQNAVMLNLFSSKTPLQKNISEDQIKEDEDDYIIGYAGEDLKEGGVICQHADDKWYNK